MTNQELSNLVNYRRRDLTQSFISNDEITAYLNEANRKLNSNYEYEWNKVSTTFTYTDGAIRYATSAIASDLNEPINIFYQDDYYFENVSPAKFMQLSANGLNMYAIDGNYMLVKTSFGTGTLTLNYYTTATAKTSGGSLLANLSASDDEPLMPELFQDTLVDFAAARCYQKEGMYDDYKIAYNDFLVGQKKLQASAPSRKKHYSKTMTNPRGYSKSTVADKSNVLNQ